MLYDTQINCKYCNIYFMWVRALVIASAKPLNEFNLWMWVLSYDCSKYITLVGLKSFDVLFRPVPIISHIIHIFTCLWVFCTCNTLPTLQHPYTVHYRSSYMYLIKHIGDLNLFFDFHNRDRITYRRNLQLFYITPTDNASMQGLVLQEHKLRLCKTCSCCKKDTRHVETKYISRPPIVKNLII